MQRDVDRVLGFLKDMEGLYLLKEFLKKTFKGLVKVFGVF